MKYEITIVNSQACTQIASLLEETTDKIIWVRTLIIQMVMLRHQLRHDRT